MRVGHPSCRRSEPTAADGRERLSRPRDVARWPIWTLTNGGLNCSATEAAPVTPPGGAYSLLHAAFPRTCRRHALFDLGYSKLLLAGDEQSLCILSPPVVFSGATNRYVHKHVVITQSWYAQWLTTNWLRYATLTLPGNAATDSFQIRAARMAQLKQQQGAGSQSGQGQGPGDNNEEQKK